MEDDDWPDPNDAMGLWEYQLEGLTVGPLRVALDSLADDLPVEVAFYNGVASHPIGSCTSTSRARIGAPPRWW